MSWWNDIYSNFDPVAVNIFGFNLHWYGIMYVLALLTALFIASWIVKKDNLPISKDMLDNYFIWVEVGVILGARIGYIIFYDSHTTYYLTHPWQMFNPFMNGEFVGIRGMSYHGALIGFVIANFIFAKRHKINQFFLLDLAAVAVPAGYVFGRIGNFLNQELIGEKTTLSIGIYVDGILRHPSQLYEAFLEGIVVFVIIYLYRTKKRFDGELIVMYGFLYGLMRFIAEFWRQPDFHIGYVCCDWMSMGHFMSIILMSGSIALYIYLTQFQKKTLTKA